LSGKLKANKPGDKKKENESFQEEDRGGHYGGEGSTDEIDRDPYSGKVKLNQEKDKKNKKSDFDEDDLGGHYDGEGSTSEVDRSPLKGRKKLAFEEDDEANELDSVNITKKKKSSTPEARENEKLRESASVDPAAVKSEEDELLGQDARDGITDFEKSKPDCVPPKSEDDLGVDELDRDALDKLKKKKEALKKAGLSDDDLDIDELDRDGLDKLKAKRKEALKAAGLLEDSDDVDDLAKESPESIKKVEAEINSKKSKDDLGVDELDRDEFDKLKKKKEALKAAGLSDDDLDIDELDRDGLDKLKAKRKEALKSAGLLEDSDDVDDLAKESPESIKKVKAKIEAKKRSLENFDIDELDRDSFESLKKNKTEKIIPPSLESDEEEEQNNKIDLKELKVGREITKEKPEINGDELISSRIESQPPKKATTKKELSIGDDENEEVEVDFKKKSVSLEAKVGRDIYNDEKDQKSDNSENDNTAELEKAKIGDEIAGALDHKEKAGVEKIIVDTSKAVKEKKLIDPDEIIGEQFNLKEIFAKDSGVSTESGELKVVITELDTNVSHICSFEDFFEEEIVVVAFKDTFEENKDYKVKLTLKYNGSNIDIIEEASVIGIEDYKNDNILVSFEYKNKIDEKVFETFMILYQERQESISNFMNLARGYYLEDEG